TTVIVFLGNGNGGFAQSGEYAVPGVPKGITTADVNGDGHLDVLTVLNDTSQLAVLVGARDGTFPHFATLDTRANPYAPTLADLEGSGQPDVSTANWPAAGGSVSVFLNSGSFSGFLSPLSLRRAFKQGCTIPIKWQLTDSSGSLVTRLSAIQSLTVTMGGTTY